MDNIYVVTRYITRGIHRGFTAESSDERAPLGSLRRRSVLRGVAGAGVIGLLPRHVAAQPATEVKLVGDPGGANDGVGRSVELQGTTLFVGANGDDDCGTNAGAVYLFERSGDTWQQVDKVCGDDTTDGDEFGFSVSINGRHLLVGAWTADDVAGSAYLFRKRGSQWVQRDKYLASDRAMGDRFGNDVTLEGNNAVVASYQDDNENGTNAGAVYLYRV